MSLHIDITGELFRITSDRKLKEIGELEQDLVYGEKHSRDIIALLSDGPALETQDKVPPSSRIRCGMFSALCFGRCVCLCVTWPRIQKN